MRIALVQPWYHADNNAYRCDPWSLGSLIDHAMSPEVTTAELVVFPELYPWDGTSVCSLGEARGQLQHAADLANRAIIAGGIVEENRELRNVAILARPGEAGPPDRGRDHRQIPPHYAARALGITLL